MLIYKKQKCDDHLPSKANGERYIPFTVQRSADPLPGQGEPFTIFLAQGHRPLAR